jgi:NADH:ubiquinone oxidoreductase subunit F (NADH-binding)
VTTSLAVPRLLAGWHETGGPADLPAHLCRYGPNPPARKADLIDAVVRAGLRGRGGGGFPTGRKLAAVAAGRQRPVVVVNACEGEPTSAKDAALLDLAPHLVLDGAVLAATALGAVKVVLGVHEGTVGEVTLARAITERADPVPVTVAAVPARYVASEESALVHFLDAGDARPTTGPRPFARGVDGRPTLVDNAETLAQLALIARFGPDWFREVGTPDRPGTYLVTVGGAVRDPGVYEVAGGSRTDAILNLAGGPARPLQAVLAGGYGGVWVRPGRTAAVGVALLLALPVGVCGLAQTAHLLRYLAGESARQCGPCTFGLPAIADDVADLAHGRGPRSALERLQRRLAVIAGRGACAHPDGAVRLASSALEVFGDDVAAHLHGRGCPAAAIPSLFPVRQT